MMGGGGGGDLGFSLLGDWLGNQRGAFDDYSDSLANLMNKFNIWSNQGSAANDALAQQYQKLFSNPAFMQDQLASQFQTSPYQKSILNNDTTLMNNNAANTGMLGSGAANKALGSYLNDQVGQFQNQYVTQGLGQYDQGLNVANNIANRGLSALGTGSEYGQESAAGRLQGDRAQDQMWQNMANDVGSQLGSMENPMGGMSGGGGGMMGGSGGGGGLGSLLSLFMSIL